MPTAGGSARSPLEQLVDLFSDPDALKQRMAEHARTKAEAEEAVLALGQRETELLGRLREVGDREMAVARREELVSDREKALALAQQAGSEANKKWKTLLPQIAELVK